MSKPRDERPPAFQFYWKQWLSDDKVLAMSWEARGMHMHFICIAYQQHSPCTLPDDDELLQSWVGFPNNWDALKKQIFRAWRHDPERGLWVQDGLLRVWEAQEAYRVSRSENASHKGKKRGRSISKAHAKHMHPSPTPTPNIDTTQEADVTRVLDHYIGLHPKRKVVGSKLPGIVRKALKDFSAAELIEALDGNASDPWCVSHGKHELGFTLRDADKINEYRAKAAHSVRPTNGSAPKSPDSRDGAW
jgi:hypothetical protein